MLSNGTIPLDDDYFFEPTSGDELSDMTEPDDDREITTVSRSKKIKKAISRTISNRTKTRNKETNKKQFNFAADRNVDLVADAIILRDAAITAGSQGPTVVCTLSEKRKAGYDGPRYVKLCYTSMGTALSVAFQNAVETRGYHLIVTPQMHAEAAAIAHHDLYAGTYKMIAMGCDKAHCPECSLVMVQVMMTEETVISKKKGKNGKKAMATSVTYKKIPTFSNFTPGTGDTFKNWNLGSTDFKDIFKITASRPKNEDGFTDFTVGDLTTANGFG